MLDLIGSVLVGLGMAVILTAVTNTMPLRVSSRVGLAGAAGAWAGLAGAVGGAGALSNPLAVLVMFGTPLVASALIILAVPGARRALGAIPLPVLEGLNIIRLAGLLFVLLAFAGRLSGPFPYFAGLGDFATGASAIPLVWLAARDRPVANFWPLAWNAFGLLDLIVAVTLGLISRNGSPLQLIHAGVGTAAMQTLPWAFIPTVLVPFFLIAHGVIFVRLRRHSAESVSDRPMAIDHFGHAH